ncbi:MAG: hypothetical protein IJ752_07170 [Alphaproteobacteria bacterium]|nr:hypothetical protein [Alphaproteobacteria bacterium]
MKKEQAQKPDRKRPDIQGDNVIQSPNQVQLPFLYLPVQDPVEKRKRQQSLKQGLYRVIKMK